MPSRGPLIRRRDFEELEYRQLVLNAGLGLLDVSLQQGAGMLVWKNLSRSNGGVSLNPEGQAAEILSLEITPSRSPDGAWILFRRGAKAIVKARNLTEVEIDWYPTGTGITSYATEGKMKRVQSGPEGDTWELELSRAIMSTSFWAQGTDTNGKTVKSMDFGNVANDDTR